MNIPNFENCPVVDKNGNWTPVWKIIMQQLISQLQVNAGTSGNVPAALSTSKILEISQDSQNGTYIWDKESNLPKIRMNDGIFHEIGII